MRVRAASLSTHTRTHAHTHTHRFRMDVVVLHVLLQVFIRSSGLVSGSHDDDDDDNDDHDDHDHAAVFLSLLRAFGFTLQEAPFD